MKKFYDYRKDGVTQGVLSQFMTCRRMTELFLEGWSSKYASSPALTFGTIVHGCLERVYGDIRTGKLKTCPGPIYLRKILAIVEAQWKKENPQLSNDTLKMLETSMAIAEATLPLYFQHHWKDEFQKIKWERLEQKFEIPFEGTIIRGKMDGVFKQKAGLWLFETKTKSQINEDNLVDTLWFELQVNLYLWAMRKLYKVVPSGVLYNIIRRTSLERKKTESLKDFSSRISAYIKKRPEFYFMRFEVVVTKTEMDAWEIQFKGMLSDFMLWQDHDLQTYKNTAQCITKYGKCPMLPICSMNDFRNFTKRKTVYRELDDF